MLLVDMMPDILKRMVKIEKKLGDVISKQNWAAGDLYRNFKNTEWRKLTQGKFPATEKQDETTHTLYVISKNNNGLATVCPTTTKKQYRKPYWFIPIGTDMGVQISAKDVYVIKGLRRPLPKRELQGEENLRYDGNVIPARLLEIN